MCPASRMPTAKRMLLDLMVLPSDSSSSTTSCTVCVPWSRFVVAMEKLPLAVELVMLRSSVSSPST